MKAELELMHEEREECRTDLDLVRNLLERCTGLCVHVVFWVFGLFSGSDSSFFPVKIFLLRFSGQT